MLTIQEALLRGSATTVLDGKTNDRAGSACRILVVDDDSTLRDTIVGYLDEHNVSASGVSSRHGLRHQLMMNEPSLIILGVEAHEGFGELQAIRACSDVPVIVLTERGDELDRVLGLELGADDCIGKPFGLRELVARVRAILRRQEIGRQEIGRTTRVRDPDRGGYLFNGWRLERRSRRLLDPDGAEVPLSKCGFALLLAFVQAPQRALSREQLLQATRLHHDIFDRSVDVQVLRLRRRLEGKPGGRQFIRTERGIGYVFAPPVEPF